MARPNGFLPRERLDALIDGVFAFAMTLLVVNIELPEGFDPTTGAELGEALLDLGDTLVAYVVTFVVLGQFWFARAGARQEASTVGSAYAWATLAQLFFVTLMPFSMIVVGRFDLAPGIWLYGGNMILLALTAAIAGRIGRHDGDWRRPASGEAGLGLLIATAILSIVIAAVSPDQAMLAYLLNAASPFFHRRRTVSAPGADE